MTGRPGPDDRSTRVRRTEVVGFVRFGAPTRRHLTRTAAASPLVLRLLPAVLSVVVVLLSCVTTVGTKDVGVVTTFGRPTGRDLENGPHLKLPWKKVTELDGAINPDSCTGGEQRAHPRRVLLRRGRVDAEAPRGGRGDPGRGAARADHRGAGTRNKNLSTSVSHDPKVLVSKCFDTGEEAVKANYQLSAGFSCWNTGGSALVER